jgi:hypothetical protein
MGKLRKALIILKVTTLILALPRMARSFLYKIRKGIHTCMLCSNTIILMELAGKNAYYHVKDAQTSFSVTLKVLP